MNRIILQPSGSQIAQEHFNNTVKNPVSISVLEQFLNNSEIEKLRSIYPNGELQVWGVTPGGSNPNKWKKIKRGDVTLFSGGGRIFASSVVTYKTVNKPLAEKLWGIDQNEETWEYLYFLAELNYHNIPYPNFNEVVGYAENFVIQGFNVLDEKKSEKVFLNFDLESEIFFEDASQNDFTNAITNLQRLKETEREVNSNRRVEQSYLRSYLFGENIIAKCACCGKSYPISLIATAHIKKRSFCSFEERTDPNVVLPMCKFGCDDLFEKGYLGVEEGRFVALGKKPESNDLNNFLESVVGNNCDFFSPNSREYFNWHLNHHKEGI